MKDKATFYSLNEEWVLPAASTITNEDRLFVTDSGASRHMVCKKDFNKAELETVRISKNPTTVGDGSASSRYTGGSFASNSARNLDVVTLGPAVKNHISSKMASTSIKTQRIMCHSLSLVHRPGLLLHHHLLLLHLHRRRLWLARKFQQQEEVKVRANLHRRTRRVNQQKSKNPTKNDNDEELHSDELQGVLDWLQEFKHGLADESVPEHRNISSSFHELWWFNSGGSQSSQWRIVIFKKSSLRCGGTKLGNTTDTIIPK